MNGLLSDVVGDGEVIRAGFVVPRNLLSYVRAPSLVSLVPMVLNWLRKYWSWMLYAVILRKIYCLIRRLRRWRRGRGRSVSVLRRHQGVNDVDSYSQAGTDYSSSIDRASYFAPSISGGPPSGSQLIFSDDVIVVNRDDRYVEVYERKAPQEANVDRKIAALLKHFSVKAK